MSRYAREHDRDRAHIRSLWVVIALFAALCGGLGWGWLQAPRHLVLRYPPELRQGAVVGVDQVPDALLYSFALYVFQQLNRWEQNGAEDYGRNIYALQAYFTDRHRAELLADLKVRGAGGELAGRTRSLTEAPGQGWRPGRVESLGEGSWAVFLDARIEEHVNNLRVKRTDIRYPLRVVRFDADPERNPWGLALDGYASEPKRLLAAQQSPPLAENAAPGREARR
jgi:integrating conjugative element protein (TIGR03746 family)